jgi:hypothetical protein
MLRTSLRDLLFRGLSFANVCTAVHVQHFPGDLTSLGQVNDRIHDVFDFWNLSHRLIRLHKLFPSVLIRGSIDDARRDRIDAWWTPAIG